MGQTSGEDDFMRVAIALSLMILAILSASSTHTTAARSEVLLPVEIQAR